jgi:hypothetical protein
VIRIWVRTGRPGFSIPGRGQGFFCSFCVQTDCGAHPVSCPVQWAPEVPCGGGRDVKVATHHHLVPRSVMSRSYACFPTKRLHGVQRDHFALHVMLRGFWNAVSTETRLHVYLNTRANEIIENSETHLYSTCASVEYTFPHCSSYL